MKKKFRRILKKYENIICIAVLLAMFCVLRFAINQRGEVIDTWAKRVSLEQSWTKNKDWWYVDYVCRYYAEGYIVDSNDKVWDYTIDKYDVVPNEDFEWIPCYVEFNGMNTSTTDDDEVLFIVHNSFSPENLWFWR